MMVHIGGIQGSKSRFRAMVLKIKQYSGLRTKSGFHANDV
jgi:hypothetical protein